MPKFEVQQEVGRTRYRRPEGWQTSRRGFSSPPRVLNQWLHDQSSLTQRLFALSGGELEVQVLSQGFATPQMSESQTLGLSSRQVALQREVILMGRGQPWVFARSIVPLSTLAGAYGFLRQLDNQPLGELLFKDPTMRRGQFELLHNQVLTLNSKLCKKYSLAWNNTVWGRRSEFHLGDKALLVAEYFLPEFPPLASSPVSCESEV